ncbi:putative ankyrin repeat-containing domain, PGG domain, protein accelerated cell death 6 [Rosa chinensis]|uniref:Putative ankyrin repeat-containing domain, PGG domain, protein accelerated cell death 6 n=1 Tax=Rosa chinensis TaxID=74649 RepID=A0A2P6PAZ8_ROSCH|nr:ankyrin repeat-containing protein At5g02620 [Rosa chinensis]PRQ19101.1 putative ankyrin repeat-containing domain, PGG domain, protein accelerated cell death 6 [Rosa chinensis]
MNPSDSAETESSPTSAYHAIILEETNAMFCSEWNQPKSIPVKKSLSGMDTKVFKEAREGNIDALREHSDYLHQILTPTKKTVLHVYIACVGSARLTESKELLKSAEAVREMLKMCQRLLLQPNESGDTVLHLAARHGRADIVGVLIQAAKDWHGDLEEGITSKEVCYQFLIRRRNEEKNTALHEAVRFNHLDVVKILTGEDPEFLYSANDAGETPVYMAAERGYRRLVFEILDTCTSSSYQGPDGLTALHVAAAYGYDQITRRLLEKEMTLATAADGEGYTPLHIAACSGHVSIVKQILECDKSTAYIGDIIYKLTPVHCAAYAGHVDVLKLLIFYCPDSFELVATEGLNALHFAIIGNQYKVEEFVRKDPWLSSVLLNSKNYVGNTPLHQIATSEKYEGLKFISDSRVDKMAFNTKNKNALDIILKSMDSQWKRNLYQGLEKSGARVGQRKSRDKDGGTKDHVSKGDEESKHKEIKESHLVVSTLIATVTFAAGITVPGGYQSEKGPDQGLAVLSRYGPFEAFVITNTLAMILSSCAVMIRFFLSLKGYHGPSSLSVPISCTFSALIAMVAAFLTGVYAVLGGRSSLGLAITVCVLGSVFFPVLGFVSISPAFNTFRKLAFHLAIRIVEWLGLEYYFF